MPMTISTDGLEEVARILNKLGNKAEDVASGSLFKGAGVVGDAFTAAIAGIRTEPFHYIANPELAGKKRYPSPEEKAALTGKSGIAHFHKNGSEVDTLIGVNPNAGYANVAGKSKAVAVIARSINSGTSFMIKQPIFRKAVSQSQGKAKAAVTERAEEMLNEIING